MIVIMIMIMIMIMMKIIIIITTHEFIIHGAREIVICVVSAPTSIGFKL